MFIKYSTLLLLVQYNVQHRQYTLTPCTVQCLAQIVHSYSQYSTMFSKYSTLLLLEQYNVQHRQYTLTPSTVQYVNRQYNLTPSTVQCLAHTVHSYSQYSIMFIKYSTLLHLVQYNVQHRQYTLTPSTVQYVNRQYTLTPSKVQYVNIQYTLTPSTVQYVNIQYTLTPSTVQCLSNRVHSYSQYSIMFIKQSTLLLLVQCNVQHRQYTLTPSTVLCLALTVHSYYQYSTIFQNRQYTLTPSTVQCLAQTVHSYSQYSTMFSTDSTLLLLAQYNMLTDSTLLLLVQYNVYQIQYTLTPSTVQWLAQTVHSCRHLNKEDTRQMERTLSMSYPILRKNKPRRIQIRVYF